MPRTVFFVEQSKFVAWLEFKMEKNNLDSFRPPWYLRNGHLQTILTSRRMLPTPSLHYEKVCVPLPNRGATNVYVSEPEEKNPNRPTLLMLHGLAGSSTSAYMIRIGRRAHDAGFRVIRVDMPGSGASAELTDLPAHAGCSSEIAAVMIWLQNHLTIDRWIVGGFSLGGNVTLKLLSELHRDDPNSIAIEKAIVVAPPIDLHYCSRWMEKGVNRIYTNFFLKNLKVQRRRRAEKWPTWAARPELPFPRSIREFDDRHTAPLAGFRDVVDYYDRASTINLLNTLHVKTSVLVDAHDPIVPFAIFNRAAWSKAVRVTVTKHGGHLGYIHRVEGKYRCWLDDWFMTQLLETSKADVQIIADHETQMQEQYS
jgi:uncharacterized protein